MKWNKCKWFRTKTCMHNKQRGKWALLCTLTLTGDMICCCCLLCTSCSSLRHLWPSELSCFRCCQGKVPTLKAVITFGNITRTKLPFGLPDNKQQMTCPCGQNTALEQSFHVKRWCLPPASAGSAGTVWPCRATPRGECFSTLQTGLCSLPLAWNTFDERAYICLCEEMCTIITADCGQFFLVCLFFRSRLRRNNMLETSSRLEEGWNNTESPLCLHFILQIQAGICVIHVCSWQNTLSF